MPREDLEDWADRFYLEEHHLAKRKTFGCQSYYRGNKMGAFIYEDALGIKLPPDLVLKKISYDPDVYSHFKPGEGIMENWLLITRPEAGEYKADLPLMQESLRLL